MPLIIAHRGACAYAPENTLASFQLAIKQGAHAIELDAKLSSDGHVMVIHDQSVNRTTNGSGAVGSLSYARLKSLDAGSFFAPQFAGEPIPGLDEVFEKIAPHLLINVELTNYSSPNDALVAKVVDLVKAFHVEEKVIFSSFHPLNLMRAAQLLPQVPRAILAEPGRKGWWARSFLMHSVAPQAVNPYFSDAPAAYIQRQHAVNRKVNVWTINQPLDLERLTRDGADGLITDDPPAAIQAVRKVLGDTLGAPNPPAW